MSGRLCAALAAFAFAACSSGAGTSFGPHLADSLAVMPQGSISAQNGALHVVFRVPRARHHRARYISPATQSFVISAQAGRAVTNAFVNVTPSSPSCSGGLLELTCSIAMKLRPGSYTVTISAYDAKQTRATGTPAGNLLSANSVATKVIAGKANALNATLDAVPKTITLTPSSGQSNVAGNDATGLHLLGGSSVTLLVAAYDADGYVIVGPGAPALTLAAQNASGGVAVAKVSNGNPNAFTLSSTSVGTATLVATATPAQGSAVAVNVAVAAVVTTAYVAGQLGSPGLQDGTGTGAKVATVDTFTYDPDNGNVYATDTCTVRQITPAGVVRTISGSGTCDSTGSDLNGPEGITYDHDDGYLYIADTLNCTIDRVTTTGTNFSRLFGTTGTCDATGGDFSRPWGIVYGGNGILFVGDSSNCQVRAIYNLDSSPVISTYAGGPAACSAMDGPRSIAFDGTDVYYYGVLHCTIRKVGAFGEVSVIAGNGFCLQFIDGTGTAAGFGGPENLAYDSADGALYVTDFANNAIRRVTTTGVVTTLFGNPNSFAFQEGTLTSPALANRPFGITFAPATTGPGSLYFDDSNAVIRRIDL